MYVIKPSMMMTGMTGSTNLFNLAPNSEFLFIVGYISHLNLSIGMDSNIVSLLQSMHERISSLEEHHSAAHDAVILMERACHAWMDVQAMMGASDDTMKNAVQEAVGKALARIRSTPKLKTAVQTTNLPRFFSHVMKTDASRRKSLGMIRGWILELLE